MANSLDLEGTVKVIGDVQTFESGFSKRELVITTQEQYPQDVKLEFFKDKTAALDNFKLGDFVKVSFNVRGNEYNGKYYVNLQAWKISTAGEAPAASAPAPAATTAAASDEDDLPF